MEVKVYSSPELEVLEVMVEKGFSGSEDNSGGGIGLPGWEII